MFILVPRLGTGNAEANKLLVYLLLFGLFIASAVVSCSEIRYTAFGRTKEAVVEKAMEQYYPGDTDKSRSTLHFDYILDDAGNKRHESDAVDYSWIQEHGPTVLGEDGHTIAVQYLAGTDSSRIAGHNHRWVMIPFGIVVLMIVVASVRFYRDFNEHQRRMAAQREE
jgi:hypothetical protein